MMLITLILSAAWGWAGDGAKASTNGITIRTSRSRFFELFTFMVISFDEWLKETKTPDSIKLSGAHLRTDVPVIHQDCRCLFN
jgi:hypothetical protein